MERDMNEIQNQKQKQSENFDLELLKLQGEIERLKEENKK
jgi:hypothetical protein